MYYIPHEMILRKIKELALEISKNCNADFPVVFKVYPVPTGGITPAYALVSALTQKNINAVVVNSPEEANIIINDLHITGETQKQYKQKYPKASFYSLFTKRRSDGRDYRFPWDTLNTPSEELKVPLSLLRVIKEDPTRQGLLETPKRFISAWKYYTSGYNVDPNTVLKDFTDGAERYTDIVLVKNIPIFSHCEHHLAPFFGMAHIGYIPNQRILGLSKFARLAEIFMRRLQVQERLTRQIADALNDGLTPQGVAVVLDCEHTCMMGRGVKVQNSSTVTSAMRGVFMDDSAARAEFFNLIKQP